MAHATVDRGDFEMHGDKRWRLHNAGYACRSGTRPPRQADGRKPGSPTLLLHRLLMADELAPGLVVDHINRDPLDNRRANLRVIPAGGNNQNTDVRPPRANAAKCVSGHRGVCWHKGEAKWRALVGVAGKTVHLGYFSDEEAAAEVARAYRAAHLPFSVT